MKTKNNTQEYLIHTLRERLRQCAVGHALTLSRSVSRLTSCDAVPCLEYREEVQAEYGVIDRLLYAQQCRAALERCLENKSATLHYRWQDGTVKTVSFQRLSLSRVSIQEL